MLNGLINLYRLARAGATLAWHGVAGLCPRDIDAPAPARWLRRIDRAVPQAAATSKSARLSKALAALGPSYIKLGQFLATRRDVIGPELADDLAESAGPAAALFHGAKRARPIRDALGAGARSSFSPRFGPPVAAASIAQVHKASVREADGTLRAVAVKILRPGVEKRFRRDLDSFYFAARQIERFHPPSRRLRPVAVVDTLAEWMRLEMDLRLEAAAMLGNGRECRQGRRSGFPRAESRLDAALRPAS